MIPKKSDEKKSSGNSLASSVVDLEVSTARNQEITDKRIRRLEKVVVTLYRKLVKSGILDES
jgi:hypothetical protein